jgi:hypothetical protein
MMNTRAYEWGDTRMDGRQPVDLAGSVDPGPWDTTTPTKKPRAEQRHVTGGR